MANILIADDDAASLDVMVVALKAEGHEVVCASNGQEAYDMALSERPDLVFLDVMMPVFDGYEVCGRLRKDPETPSDLPIIFLTSLDPDGRRLDEVGATDYLPKHHMVVQLRDMLVKHLGPDAVTDG